ncbi:NAD-dependent epimerase/dehydratase family protein [Streptomyces sp. NPDC096013]|uniref:NAD-dependent epimerase/dehydratase family protein n=1 Tax=Streptomyces sp. NPDC096013 TaxID=3366069 RepID=UPI0038266BAE
MKVLVTGGAGFIGTHVCRHLAAQPAVSEVVALDDLSTGHRDGIDALRGVRLVRGSVLDTMVLREAMADASSVVHLAARASVQASVTDPRTVHDVNATGTVLVLESARRLGVPHVVVASSSAVYGTAPSVAAEESLLDPLSPYAAGKVAAEAYTTSFARSYGLSALTLRFFNVFGPRQAPTGSYAAVVPAFISAALAGRPLTIYGDGRQTRDFVHVDYVARTLVAAVLERVVSDRPVNLASGRGTSLLELVACLEKLLGRELPVVHAPTRPGEVRHSRADTRRLRELFGTLELEDLATGLAHTLDWYRATSPR